LSDSSFRGWSSRVFGPPVLVHYGSDRLHAALVGAFLGYYPAGLGNYPRTCDLYT